MTNGRTTLTDEMVEEEIARLLNNDNVKLARLETRIKYRRRQYLYGLRAMEKRGAELRAAGVDESNIEEYLNGGTEEDYEA